MKSLAAREAAAFKAMMALEPGTVEHERAVAAWLPLARAHGRALYLADAKHGHGDPCGAGAW